jgi:hypothetical protein
MKKEKRLCLSNLMCFAFIDQDATFATPPAPQQQFIPQQQQQQQQQMLCKSSF